jgi:bis(5'-nucleosyl)-tetraphosphatase (symmetrical)
VTRYAVGDLQGCFDPLRHLLDRVRFDPARDQLWAVGDLVNRGPQSLECLRFIRNLGSSARVVLGNHDLHLLAVAAGIRKLKRGDTLQPILDAPDAAELLDWVAHQPLFYREPDYVMAHAGLAPQWTIDDAERLSDEVSAVLTGCERLSYLNAMYGDEPARWSDALQGPTRWRVITNYFTRMRFCDAEGTLDLTSKEGPESAPPGYMPWFNAPNRRSAGTRIIFGHWASLQGKSYRDDAIALDTGCVWGNSLTLFSLDTKTHSSCRCK